jgi:flagellin-like protein
MGNDKRGITPVIATVLLIAIVVVVIGIILVWSRSFINESVQKKGLPADQACSQIRLTKSCNDGVITITNLGNIPVYEFDIKKNEGGRTIIQHSSDEIGVGLSVRVELESCPSSYKIIPAILGDVQGGRTIYTCTKNEF